jgi:hypothetical protein
MSTNPHTGNAHPAAGMAPKSSNTTAKVNSPSIDTDAARANPQRGGPTNPVDALPKK